MKENKFKVGDEVTIVACINGHQFNIGEVVRLEADKDTDGEYKAVGKKDYWYVTEEEVELVEEVTSDGFVKWLDEKIVNLLKLDVSTNKLQEVKRIYKLYLEEKL